MSQACARAVVAMVRKKSMTTRTAWTESRDLSLDGVGLPSGSALWRKNAGISQFTKLGTMMWGKSRMPNFPFCQIIRVVMSPKGEKAPPAFDATTMLTRLSVMKSSWEDPTDRMTAPMRSAVVRLSARGERRKERGR